MSAEDKKIRPMTAKKFAKMKLSAKGTAEGLIAQHLNFLENHSFLTDILTAYKNKELLPTPTLQTCQHLLFTHVIESELKTAQNTIAKDAERYEKAIKDASGNVISSSIPNGNYLITLMVKKYDESGEVIGVEVGIVKTNKTREVEKDDRTVIETYVETSPAIWSADDYGSAERLADRRLVAREDSVYCVIENTIGKKIETNIMRDDGFARTFKRNKEAVCKVMGKSTPTLKWQPKCVQTRSIGPWSMR